MDNFTKLILILEGLLLAAIVVVIIYLIVRRIRTKENEDFENRDN